MRLRELRMEKKLLQKDVANLLGVDRTTYVKYENGSSELKKDTLIALANIFSVSVDYLLGNTDQRTEKPTPEDGDGLDPEEQKVMNLVTKLTPEQQRFLLAWLKTALSQEP